MEANLIAPVRMIVDSFVATRNVEKGKSVGRSPVNEKIVEYLCQRMEQSYYSPLVRNLLGKT
jgi:hypothetical protein